MSAGFFGFPPAHAPASGPTHRQNERACVLNEFETAARRDGALLHALSTPHKRQKEMRLGARREKAAVSRQAPCASFLDAVSEIEALVREPGIPRDRIDSFSKILN
jgi:hypothetical protein